MELIIQAVEDQSTEVLFQEYWNIIKPILEKDFHIHEYTIYYWADFENESLDNSWRISALMRNLWAAIKG
jgi:hypothetical protein